jgi:hypothetical protein
MTDAQMLTPERLAEIRRTTHDFAFHWLHKEQGERRIFELLQHIDAQQQAIAAMTPVVEAAQAYLDALVSDMPFGDDDLGEEAERAEQELKDALWAYRAALKEADRG